MKPNSLSSSRSGSSRSGASSTQSMVHNSAPRGPRPRLPVVAALKESGQPENFPPVPPPYNHVVPKPLEPGSSPKASPAKLRPGNLARMGATPVMIPRPNQGIPDCVGIINALTYTQTDKYTHCTEHQIPHLVSGTFPKDFPFPAENPGGQPYDSTDSTSW